MSSIALAVQGTIQLITVGQVIYHKISEYMDEMEAIKQSGSDKKTRVLAFARSLILKAGKDWTLWQSYVSAFIDAAKNIYNVFRTVFIK